MADTPSAHIYTLSLHDALPICVIGGVTCSSPEVGPALLRAAAASSRAPGVGGAAAGRPVRRSEEHTSELQSRFDLVWRLLLEKKKPVTETNASKRMRAGVVWCC